jgi:hypothetical protein
MTGTETQDTRKTRVGHCKADETDVYAGRGQNNAHIGNTEVGNRGWLGNPFTVDDHDRAEAISKYRRVFHLRIVRDDEFREAVKELAGQSLGCWCQRLDEDGPACHAEVIAKWADRLSNKTPQKA